MEQLKYLPTSKKPTSDLPASSEQFISQKVRHGSRTLQKAKKVVMKLSLPPNAFMVWENQTRYLKEARLKILNGSPKISVIAGQLDEGVYDRCSNLSWKGSQDLLTQHTESLVALKRSRAAKPFNWLDRILQRITGNTFKRLNRRDISSYLKAVILHTQTPEALTHIYRLSLSLKEDKHISKAQFRRLHTAIKKRLQTNLPELCKSLQQIDYLEEESEQAKKIIYGCHDLAIIVKECFPRMLQKRLKICKPLRLGAWLEQMATKAYKQSVDLLPVCRTNDEAKATLNHSLMLLHDLVKPTLQATTGKKSIPDKKSTKRVNLKLRNIQKETNHVHYKLLKPQRKKGGVLSLNEQLRRKETILEEQIRSNRADLKELQAFRTSLREQQAKLIDEQGSTPDKKRWKQLKYGIKDMDKLIAMTSKSIQNLHKQIISFNEKLNKTDLRLVANEETLNTFIYKTALEADKDLGTFYQEQNMNPEHIQAFQNAIWSAEQELQLPKDEVNIIFEKFVQWLEKPYISPGAAIYYLRDTIEQYKQIQQINQEKFDLDLQLLDEDEAVEDDHIKFIELATMVKLDQTDEMIGTTETNVNLLAQYKALIHNDKISANDAKKLERLLNSLTQDKQWPQEQITIAFEYYMKWIDQLDATNTEALFYLNHAVKFMEEGGSLEQLRSTLDEMHIQLEAFIKQHQKQTKYPSQYDGS